MDSTPCFVCGRELRNDWDTDGPQPDQGLAFQTTGHYGSRFFEATAGQILQLCICDRCVREGTERLQTYREYREIRCLGVLVGKDFLDRDPIPYDERNDDGRDDETPDVVNITIEEMGDGVGRNVHWFSAGMLEAREVEKENRRAEARKRVQEDRNAGVVHKPHRIRRRAERGVPARAEEEIDELSPAELEAAESDRQHQAQLAREVEEEDAATQRRRDAEDRRLHAEAERELHSRTPVPRPPRGVNGVVPLRQENDPIAQ